MSSQSTIDLIPLERNLHAAEASLRDADSDNLWQEVTITAREIANNLRVRNSASEFHNLLAFFMSFRLINTFTN